MRPLTSEQLSEILSTLTKSMSIAFDVTVFDINNNPECQKLMTTLALTVVDLNNLALVSHIFPNSPVESKPRMFNKKGVTLGIIDGGKS
jgi:hypothetical protein